MFKCVLYWHNYSIQGAGLVITSGHLPGLARLGGPPRRGELPLLSVQLSFNPLP